MKKKRIRKKSENFLQLHIGHFRILSAVIFRLSAGK
jgi:mRNA-degrading endonuclease RelE of RelBE toxin-antitoxin system